MKVSNYFGATRISDDRALIWSGLSGYIAFASNSILNALEKNRLDLISDEKKISLKNNGILVNTSLKEIEIVSEFIKRSVKNAHTISRVILILNRDCNCACCYCYQESKSNKHISKNVINKTTEYVLNNVDKNSILRIGLFGGEPLLNKDIVKYVINQFRELKDKKLFKDIRFMITTNGTIFSRYLNDLFFPYKDLERIQITLDGLESSHNFTRPFVNGKGTYKKILKNLHYFIALSQHVVIRLNLHKGNVKDMIPISKYLLDNYDKNKLTIYLARIKDYNNCNNHISRLPTSEYKAILREFYEFYFEHKNCLHPDLDFRKKYIGCRSAFALPKWIGPEGELFQCQHQPDTSFVATDNLHDFHNYNLSNDYPYESLNNPFATINDTPLYVKKCLLCNYLAFFGGACALDRKTKIDVSEDCELWQMRFEVYSKLLYKQKKEV